MRVASAPWCAAEASNMQPEADSALAPLSPREPPSPPPPAFVRRIRWLNACVVHPSSPPQYLFCLVFWLAAIAGPVALLVFWPRVVDDVITPALEKIKGSVPKGVLVLIIITCLSTFPLVWLTCEPLVWLSAFVYSFGTALLVCTAGYAVGMLLPFLAGRTFLRHRIRSWLHHFPKAEAVFRAAETAGDGRVILLMRLGPFPFSATNYFCGLLHHVNPLKYWLISVVVNEPFLVVSVAFGKSLKGLADLLRGEHLAGSELAILIVGFVSTLVLSIAGVVYFRRALQQLKEDEALRLAGVEPEAHITLDASATQELSTVPAAAPEVDRLPATELDRPPAL